jgi:hypothetical protein
MTPLAPPLTVKKESLLTGLTSKQIECPFFLRFTLLTLTTH